MVLENFNLKITNYKLSQEQRSILKNGIESLSAKLPYGSRINLVLIYKNKGLEGKLVVSSHKRRFYAKTQDLTLKALINSLSAKVRRQVKKWKHTRTHKEITSITRIPIPAANQDRFYEDYREINKAS